MPSIAPLAQRRKTRILIPILIIIVLITIINFLRPYLANKPEVVVLPPVISQKKVEIDWSVFKNPVLTGLTIFEQTPSFKEKPGRDNPFEPY